MSKFFFVVFAALLMACHGQPASDHSPCDGGASCPLPSPPQTADVIAEDNWQFVLMGDGWTSVESSGDSIKVMLVNKQIDLGVFFVKENTTDDLSSYVMSSLMSFQQAGAEIVKVKTTIVSGNQAVLAELHGNRGSNIWLWMTVKDGFAYVFTCGSKNDSDLTARFDYCDSVAHTIQIK